MIDCLSFQELEYTQPSISVTKASEAAILVIRDLLTTTPSLLPYIMEPSAILLFANLRAQSPYHLFGKEVSDKKKAELDTVLLRHNLCRWNDDTSYDEPKSGIFSLINTAMFNEIPNNYGFTKDIWKSPVASPTVPQICEWILVTERALVSLMESGQLPKEWLRDWWAPHNLRFGMLLGYPGAAISSNLWAEAHLQEVSITDPIEEVTIAKEGQYFGSRVSFYSTTTATNDPLVKSIQHTWSEVIKRVYDAIPLKELLLNKDFVESYRSLERLGMSGL